MDKVQVEVALRLKRKFSHKEFLELCERYGVRPVELEVFAQYSGMLYCAIEIWPDMDPYDALRMFITKMNERNKEQLDKMRAETAYTRQSHVTLDPEIGKPVGMPMHAQSKPCGHCGGKR